MIKNINKNWLILIAALVVGGIAAYGTKSYITNKVEDIEARNRNKVKVKVVVPKENLEKGATLSAANMAIREIPQEWAVSGAITPGQFNRAEGAVLAFEANKGETVTWSQIVGEKAPIFSTKLDLGRRAVTVPVDEVSSISGMVQPDDLIDIVVSLKKHKRNYTFTLLQSVRVLATGKKISPETKDVNGRPITFTTVTLDTTPQDAKRLIAARQIGKVTALLRSPGDVASISTDRASAEDLLGLGMPSSFGLSSVPVIYGGGEINVGLYMNPQKKLDDFDLLNGEKRKN
jgi:pilus assembly protein CpaB